MAIEIVDLLIKKMWFSIVMLVYQITTLQSKLLKIPHLFNNETSMADFSALMTPEGVISHYIPMNIPMNIESFSLPMIIVISNYITNKIPMISPVKSQF